MTAPTQNARTPGERELTEGSNAIQLAAHLSQRWNPSLWGDVSRLLLEGDPSGPIRRAASGPRQVQRRLSEERWDQIVAAYVAGASTGALAKEHGVDADTVLRRLKSRGVTIRQVWHVIPDGEVATIRELRASGWTLAGIAERYGCSRRTISSTLKRCPETPASKAEEVDRDAVVPAPD